MKSKKRRGILLALLGLLNNCTGIPAKQDLGPKITGCVLSVQDAGFYCTDGQENSFFVSFTDARPLQCISGTNLESFFKGCKTGKLVKVTWCGVEAGKAACTDERGGVSTPDIATLDNYFCLSPKDLARVSERCSL